jgi:hypothetical protein
MLDTFLSSRLEKYRQWLDADQIDYSAKVVPVQESLDGKQWILPTEQVWGLLEGAETIALSKCVCRSHYKRCNHPVEVCLLLNQFGRQAVAKGLGRQITFRDAVPVLKAANERGLVHLSFYQPDRDLYALCSCCECCCHDLQLLLDFCR